MTEDSTKSPTETQGSKSLTEAELSHLAFLVRNRLVQDFGYFFTTIKVAVGFVLTVFLVCIGLLGYKEHNLNKVLEKQQARADAALNEAEKILQATKEHQNDIKVHLSDITNKVVQVTTNALAAAANAKAIADDKKTSESAIADLNSKYSQVTNYVNNIEGASKSAQANITGLQAANERIEQTARQAETSATNAQNLIRRTTEWVVSFTNALPTSMASNPGFLAKSRELLRSANTREITLRQNQSTVMELADYSTGNPLDRANPIQLQFSVERISNSTTVKVQDLSKSSNDLTMWEKTTWASPLKKVGVLQEQSHELKSVGVGYKLELVSLTEGLGATDEIKLRIMPNPKSSK